VRFILKSVLHVTSKSVARFKLENEIENFTGLTKKYHSGNLHQISNTEWWYHNVQFGGNVLFRR